MAPTAIAPAITSARDGSQRPARSRNPSTFAGLAIPETMRPSPKTRPARKAQKRYMSERKNMARQKHGGETRGHEHERRDKRARRQARQATNAMAAGTARAITRADADHESRHNQRRIARIDNDLRRRPQYHVGDRSHNQSGDKCSTPESIGQRWAKQSADDAADSRHPPVGKRKQRGGQADEHTARQCRPRRKRSPIDIHRAILTTFIRA